MAEANGTTQTAQPGEDMIPAKVVQAICKAWPDQAAEILRDLRHNRDHYYIERWGMYVGIEYDGYIHS